MRYFLPVFLLSLFIAQAQAQGCSDAGLCTIKSFRPAAPVADAIKNNQLIIGLSAGAADHEILATGIHLGYSRRLGSVVSVDTRISYNIRSGNDITNTGPGDVFINLNVKPVTALTLTAGVKVPLTNGGDESEDALPLPMDYQTSLGTLDLVTGIAYHTPTWQFVIAWQQPLSQNENQFDPLLWPEGSPLRNIQRTVGFTRKGDVLARISYPFGVNDQISITPSLLPILHLGEDEYLNTDNQISPIEGSGGLTLNAGMFFDIDLGEKSKLGISLGFPLVVREVRPDGLTRGFVLGAEYAINF